MKTLLNTITKDEKKRILEMHKNATKRNYLQEQGTPPPGPPNPPTPFPNIDNPDQYVNQKFRSGDDMVKYFGFSPIKSTNPDEKPDAKTYETQTNFANLIKKASIYYIKRGIQPTGNNSLTKLFQNEPILKQVLNVNGPTPAKFTEGDLNKRFQNYLNYLVSPQ